jgi:hypothetical protein
VGVRVQRLDRAGVAETGLHRFHALPVPDEQTCIVMAQRVKPGPGSGPRIVPGILGVAEPITVPTW